MKTFLVIVLLIATVLSVKGEGDDNGRAASLGKVTCQATTMTVTFNNSELEGNVPQVGEEGCGAKITDDNTTTTVVVPLDNCDTDARPDSENGKQAYLNKIILSGESDSVITRMDSKVFPFGCIYDMTGNASRSFVLPKRNVTYYEKGYGTFHFKMDFFEDDKFEKAFDDADYPLNVKLAENIFVQTSVSNVGDALSIYIEECVATPSMKSDHETRYVLLKNGCMKDGTMKEYDSKSTASKSFSFKSFRFSKRQGDDAIYVHCKLKVCHEDSDDSVCKDGCKEDNSRRRRANRDEGSNSNGLSGGPVMIVGAVQSGFNTVGHSHTSLIIGCAVGAVALVALAIIGAVLFTKRHS